MVGRGGRAKRNPVGGAAGGRVDSQTAMGQSLGLGFAHRCLLELLLKLNPPGSVARVRPSPPRQFNGDGTGVGFKLGAV